MSKRKTKDMTGFIKSHNRNFLNSIEPIADDAIHQPSAGTDLKVKIVSQGSKGDGVAKYHGYTVFVPGAEVGSEVKVVVRNVHDNLVFAEKVSEA